MKKQLILGTWLACTSTLALAAPNPFASGSGSQKDAVPEVPGSGRQADEDTGPERPDGDALRVSAIVGQTAVLTTGTMMMAIKDGMMVALPEGEFRAIIDAELQNVSLLDVDSGELVWQSSVAAYVVEDLPEEPEDRSVTHAQLVKSLDDSLPEGTGGIGAGNSNNSNSNSNSGGSNNTSSSGF